MKRDGLGAVLVRCYLSECRFHGFDVLDIRRCRVIHNVSFLSRSSPSMFRVIHKVVAFLVPDNSENCGCPQGGGLFGTEVFFHIRVRNVSKKLSSLYSSATNAQVDRKS